MYQYKATLKSSKEIIAEGHTLEDVEKQLVHYKREQKKGIHTHGNDPVEIWHVKQDHVDGGLAKDELIKVV